MQCHALVAQFFEEILYGVDSAFDTLPHLHISMYLNSTLRPTRHPSQ